MSEESELSKMILEIIPPVMRAVRHEVREAAGSQLTVPQTRILAHLFRGVSDATTLSELQGVSLPAISKMVDSLVGRDLVTRRFSENDRRQAGIFLTDKGRELFLKSRKAAQMKLSGKIGTLNKQRQKMLRDGLEVMRAVFLTEIGTNSESKSE